MSRVRGSLNATISGKTDQVSYVFGAYRISLFGAKWLFLASMSCVKVFRSTFRAMSFQDLHWLQKLGSCKPSFGAKVVGRCVQHLTSTHMTLY